MRTASRSFFFVPTGPTPEVLKHVVLIAGLATLLPQGDGIIRLKPREFRQLPAAVRRDLDRRGCTIPQASWKTAPHNVITGSFIAKGSRDWAVLCSVNGRSRVLVYRNGGATRVDSTVRQRDVLQTGANGVSEFARTINIATAKSIADHAREYGGPKPPPLDHEGIEDGGETASIVRYYFRGKWLQLQGGIERFDPQ
jgi:hypothetical protein